MNIFHHGHVAVQAKFLGNIPDQVFDGFDLGVSHYFDCADRRIHNAENHPNECGFSRAIRPYKTKDFAVIYRQVHSVHGGNCGKFFRESLRPDHSKTTSAGKPGFMISAAFSIFTLMPNTILARSRCVMLWRGVYSAFWLISLIAP